MSRISGLVILAATIFLIFIAIRSSSPPAVRLGEIADTSFSVQRAYTHLLQIAKLPHSTGTIENDRVREYILNQCNGLGFTVQVQNTTGIYNKGGYVNAASLKNIIAIKKGLSNSKAVMLMAHYDTQFNSPGAADDGAAVAAMLETARALQHSGPLQNNLILLFTDAEEIGLLGARAFVQESPLMKDIGLVVNFESRGNAGPSFMFELNDNNGWAIKEYAGSVAHPFANSLAYEVYKKMPNYTDFTPFKEAGIAGWNNACIDGFANYHSANDKPQNIDLRTIQHHGDNMLSLAKHFGNISIGNTSAPDASYFNAAGGWFVHYPASWNLPLVLFANLLFIILIGMGFKTRQFKTGGLVAGAILFPAVLGIIYFCSKITLRLIISSYPLYTHFDENNSYNGAWYFLAISALAVAIFSLAYSFAAKKAMPETLLAGVLLTVISILNITWYAMPSASYLLLIPVLFILVFRLLLFNKKISGNLSATAAGGLNLISVLPVIFLIVPTIYFVYIAFGLGTKLPGIAVATGVAAGLLLPVFYGVYKNYKLLVPAAAAACFIAAIAGGHFTAKFSEKQPVQSSVYYTLDADSCKAKWQSGFIAPDKWSAPFFTNKSTASKYQTPVSTAPLLQLQAVTAIVIKDTVYNGQRKMLVHLCHTRPGVTGLNIAIANSSKVQKIILQGKEVRVIKNINSAFVHTISYTGPVGEGINIAFEMEGNNKLEMTISDHSIGLPEATGFNTVFPEDVVPGRGYSNTTMVTKRLVL